MYQFLLYEYLAKLVVTPTNNAYTLYHTVVKSGVHNHHPVHLYFLPHCNEQHLGFICYGRRKGAGGMGDFTFPPSPPLRTFHIQYSMNVATTHIFKKLWWLQPLLFHLFTIVTCWYLFSKTEIWVILCMLLINLPSLPFFLSYLSA